MKKKLKIYYEEERLYCDSCGEDISDNGGNSERETLYKTRKITETFKHQDIVGKKFKCLKCNHVYIEDEYNYYPIMHKRYE